MRSPIVVAQQTIAEANALADMDIIDAYQDAVDAKLGSKDNPWVSLVRLRTALSIRGWSRERQDEHLRRFVRERKGIAIPESNQKVMDARDRASAVRIGNEDKHLFMVKK